MHKNINLFVLFAVLFLSSCDKDWQNHYGQQDFEIDNIQIEMTDKDIESYLQTSDYAEMTMLFEKTGIFAEMAERKLLYTVYVVGNEVLTVPTDTTASKFLARSHIHTASISPSNLKDGQRVVVWNGKYVDVSVEGSGEDVGAIGFNGSHVVKVVKASNGYIYVLDRAINTPQSLLEVLENLDDAQYSLFKDMVLSKNVAEFNRSASLPIGVNEAGNTLYDSVFTIRNPYFQERGVNLFTEAAEYTVLIPSNEQITSALQLAKETVAEWGVERQDSIFENWIFQAAFFKEKLTPDRFENPEEIDLFSAFDKQWRTTVNKVDLNNPVELSNGIAYYMTALKIPNNVLLWRYKDYFHWYEFLTAEDKDKYYQLTNLRFDRVSTEVAAWTPGYGWPQVENRAVWFPLADKEILDGALDFTAFRITRHADNSYDLSAYKLPPGEYTLHLGFASRHRGSILDVSFNDELVRTLSVLDYQGYSRDRSGGGGPEFYPSNLDNKYDRDGGLVDTIRVTGTELVPIKLTLRGYDHTTSTTLAPMHWTIRPTTNNY